MASRHGMELISTSKEIDILSRRKRLNEKEKQNRKSEILKEVLSSRSQGWIAELDANFSAEELEEMFNQFPSLVPEKVIFVTISEEVAIKRVLKGSNLSEEEKEEIGDSVSET